MATVTSSFPLLTSLDHGFRPHFGPRAVAPVGSTALAQPPRAGETKDELRSLARTGRASALLRLLSLQWVKSGKHNVDELARDQRGNTLLMLAAQAGHHETVTVLLQLGASVWTTSKTAKSVVFTRKTPTAVSNEIGTPATRSPHRSRGCSTELRYGGMTAVHYAASSGSLKTVQALCESGQGARMPVVAVQAADGSSVLHCAITGLAARRADCQHQQASMTSSPLVERLISYGADINIACASRRRWCSLLGRPCRLLQSRVSRGLTPLHCAVDAGDKLTVAALLAAGCQVDACTSVSGLCDRKQTALHFACEQLQPAIVRLLLNAGASPNVTDQYGATPMHLVMSSAADLALNSFGMCGAVAYDVNLLDSSERKQTAEARAAIVKMLLEAGADRFAEAQHRPTDDPASGRLPVEQKNLTVANMASTQLTAGGAEVLLLLGTCFTQPRSLKDMCRLAVRQHMKTPINMAHPASLQAIISDSHLMSFLLFKDD